MSEIHEFADIGEDARRQYIDALSVFTALEEARNKAMQFRGGMLWKKSGRSDYLIRTQTDNSQQSLGVRSVETEAVYDKFMTAKKTIESRIQSLREALERHKRMNRALYVGRAPQILVNILNMFDRYGIAKHFLVIGTHALYAYEAAAGARIRQSAALATNDVDLLWDTRRRLEFAANMKNINLSMIGLLKKVDASFEVCEDQRYTAVNSAGFEVDIIRREAVEGDPHPLRLTSAEDDFSAVQTRKSGKLLSSKPFTSVIVSSNGSMARIHSIAPDEFVKLKKWLSRQTSRDVMKKSRDALQAGLVGCLIKEYLPQYSVAHNVGKVHLPDDLPPACA